MNDTLLDFPQKLTTWRMEHGMTILQFRQRCGMSKTSYYSLMNRTHFPNAKTIANICRCTGMSADYLLGLADKDGRPEHKKGKWYHAWANDYFDVTDWECSECGGIIHNTERTDFCPHCGADMRIAK